MNIITLDFETYFDADYTLSKMTTESYVRDKRFEAHGCGVRYADGRAEWLGGDAIAEQNIDWLQTAVLCHHAHFDGLILSHRYGITPAFWLDTLCMARMVLGTHERLGLDKLCQRYGIKGKTIDYSQDTGFKGWRWRDMPLAIRANLSNGCLDDLEATWQLLGKLKGEFPAVEYPIVDLTVRMFTEPKLAGDTEHFAAVRDAEFQSKNELLYSLGVGESDLSSNDKFVRLLEGLGVDVDMKMSAATKTYPQGRLVPAVAKNDRFMQELLEDDDETLATLARARVETKSTINETRSGRLYGMSQRGALCVYLNYAGANTRRWSGGDSTNFQNLGRDGKLRKGVRAPDGWLIAAPDQSQGECRLLNWLAGQDDVVERFARGEDVYLPMASAFYKREITKADKRERQVGKGIELGCGFGMGAPKLKGTLAKQGVALDDAEAKQGVDTYRATHPAVVALWREGDKVLRALADKEDFTWRIFAGRDGRLYHPNGTWLDYATLEWHADETTGDRFWRLRTRDGWKKMYGAKLVENAIQWLSRIVTSEAMVKFQAMGLPVVGMSHDDVWLLTPARDPRKDEIAAVMATTPSWAPGLPLGADCKLGATYG